MARKTNKAILTEGEMRRFMKLAKISPLQEMGYGMPGARDEEEDEPGMRDDMMEQEEEEILEGFEESLEDGSTPMPEEEEQMPAPPQASRHRCYERHPSPVSPVCSKEMSAIPRNNWFSCPKSASRLARTAGSGAMTITSSKKLSTTGRRLARVRSADA